MKYYLVVREKKENIDIQEFGTRQAALTERPKLKAKHPHGEVVFVYAKDIKAMFDTFSEYKPKNWQDYVRKLS